jgi:UDP-glucose:O-linked fucose beta-1,3-glucosyltransferase
VANRKLESFKNDKEQLLSKINKLNLENENAMRALKAVMKRKEELLVQENFVRLDVKRLRDLLYMRADEVLGLENRKHQLKLSMEERKQEIVVHKSVLRAELRTAEEERHLRAKDLAERLIKIDKLKRKYQLILLQISPEGEQEEHSQAYFIIRAAQVSSQISHMYIYTHTSISKRKSCSMKRKP